VAALEEQVAALRRALGTSASPDTLAIDTAEVGSIGDDRVGPGATADDTEAPTTADDPAVYGSAEEPV
jgi:hypothetical protein